MNIREAIHEEHSREQALRVAEYACTSAKHFKELMKCFNSNESRLAQRAAWSVSWAARKKPEMVMPHLADLVSVLERKDTHPALIRNAVRVLEAIDIPEAYHGKVMNACFGFIENPATPVAIKAFSLTTLFNLSVRYPDIRPELKLIIEERMPEESAAFKARGRKILQQLRRQ
ncbi:hypothetical protein [Sediminibacterium ginsengisoli]|uniref:HEAT repeat-containing protein n=1 Tax=Sediminibacterium ginsengisoli TaxID=413434 RepID=A0A1T4PQ93_9BACT|nr:hypothetical protein [Sediminibacterium ginsengisoli]SJZ93048.1 hypothetical protein SAMN04488132_106121 [Sediminibacterium ginsengisoli]